MARVEIYLLPKIFLTQASHGDLGEVEEEREEDEVVEPM